MMKQVMANAALFEIKGFWCERVEKSHIYLAINVITVIHQK